MYLKANILAVLLGVLALGACARPRPRLIRPVQEEEDQQAYQADDRSAGDRVVLVSADEYENLYRAADRVDDDEYTAPRALPNNRHTIRQKEQPKQPPVQTIRNYNKVNDDGSFTFGYEAADGSFKEETRGTDCVVRGKYGYIDPDGNKREFTYVSGNPCDPNKPDEDEEQSNADNNEADDDEPANYPVRPVARPRPTTPRPTTTYFQNDYRNDEEEEEEEPLQHIRPAIVQRRPSYVPQPIAITPRPLQAIQSTTPRALPPATTFRPQLIQVSSKPTVSYSQQPTVTIAPTSAPTIITSPRPTHLDFAAEFAKFQNENQVSTTTSAGAKDEFKASPPAGNPIYTTELVYDPSSGQYKTQLYQTLPQTKGELNLNQRLQSFVAQPQPRPFVPSPQISIQAQQQQYHHQQQQQQQQQRPLTAFRPHVQAAPAQINTPQEIYQRQKAENQYQNSAQLFAQQHQLQQSQLQRDRAVARAQAQRLSHQQIQPQQFYYVAPRNVAQSPSQIDEFLRGHGIQF